MLVRSFKIAALAVVFSAAVSSAFAGVDAQNPAYDRNNLPVLDMNGSCILTHWEGAGAADCGGAKPVAAPTPVVAPVAKKPAPVAVVESDEERMARTIFFDFDSAKLTPASKEKLRHLYKKLTDKSERILRADIVGYTDEIGTNEYNYKLSQKRAAAVDSFLKSLGYNASKVTGVRALGERSSAGKCPTTMSRKARIACLWEDRRVELEFDYQTEAKAK